MDLEKMFKEADKGMDIEIPQNLSHRIHNKAKMIEIFDNIFYSICAFITVILLIDPSILGNIIPVNEIQNFSGIGSMPVENHGLIVFNPLKISFFSAVIAGTIPPLFYFFIIKKNDEEIKIEK